MESRFEVISLDTFRIRSEYFQKLDLVFVPIFLCHCLECIYIMDTWISDAWYPLAWFTGRQATWTLTWLNRPITLPLIFMSLPLFITAAFNATSVFINTVPFMLFALMTLLGNLFHVPTSLRESLILPQFVCLAPRPL